MERKEDDCGNGDTLPHPLNADPPPPPASSPESSSPLPPPAKTIRQIRVGEQVGRFRILDVLGQGGFGEVYRVFDDILKAELALKVLRSEKLRAGNIDADLLMHEARIALALNEQHDGFVHVRWLDHLPEEFGGDWYLAMELLTGQTLERWLLSRPPWPEVLRRIQELCEIIGHAHARGLVHCDLKPANVFLTRSGRLKVLDMGLAGRFRPTTTTAIGVAGLRPVGPTGAGTPAYMSPELLCRHAATPAADVWAIGVMLYEATGANHPFDEQIEQVLDPARSAPSLRGRIIHSLAGRHRVTAALDAVLARALAKDPGARFPTAREFADALRARPARRRRLTIATAAGLCIGAGLAVLFHRVSNGLPPEGTIINGMVLHHGGAITIGSTDEQIGQAVRRCYEEFLDQGEGNKWCEEKKIRVRERRWPVVIAPFLLDPTEVTREQFAAWLTRSSFVPDERTPSQDRWVYSKRRKALINLVPEVLTYTGQGFVAPAGTEQLPANQVTWEAAARYCEAQDKRLPTQAEYEYAARGRTLRLYPWGDAAPSCDGVNHGRDPLMKTCAPRPSGPVPVGSSAQDVTPLGVYDLAGNVAEWVHDQYFEDRAAACPAPCNHPRLESAELKDDRREIRGGASGWPAAQTRGAVRSRLESTGAYRDLGFRCARDFKPPP